jgi:hypothetical protein
MRTGDTFSAGERESAAPCSKRSFFRQKEVDIDAGQDYD